MTVWLSCPGPQFPQFSDPTGTPPTKKPAGAPPQLGWQTEATRDEDGAPRPSGARLRQAGPNPWRELAGEPSGATLIGPSSTYTVAASEATDEEAAWWGLATPMPPRRAAAQPEPVYSQPPAPSPGCSPSCDLQAASRHTAVPVGSRGHGGSGCPAEWQAHRGARAGAGSPRLYRDRVSLDPAHQPSAPVWCAANGRRLAAWGRCCLAPVRLLIRKQEPVPGGTQASTCQDVACMAVGSCPLCDSQSSPQHSGNFQCPPLINGRVAAVSSGSSCINRPGPDRPEEGREEPRVPITLAWPKTGRGAGRDSPASASSRELRQPDPIRAQRGVRQDPDGSPWGGAPRLPLRSPCRASPWVLGCFSGIKG
ncbi:basic salivary proline-rich protein 2-like [Prionailurus bengalensis]|uniref:basic salivary proline-rich protein 2-like n=1 Tax=Prionailurus bengalensis TaxID=37029 RepID=UPI001CA9465F|nr:basic salivary proline-rich protein 2-like [Prionailurus bengalensis]